MLICLDAGHGKDTAGKRAFDESFFEWEFNRDVTARVKALLEDQGLEVLLTASGETDVPLAERAKIANSSEADIVVSIHANAYGTDWNTANGWSIFRHTGSTKGLALAKAIQGQSIPFLGLRDRGINEAEFYILKYTRAPAVLIEHGFFTNKAELVLLKTDVFRQKCALADAKGILDYFGVPWKDYKSLYLAAEAKLDRIRKALEE